MVSNFFDQIQDNQPLEEYCTVISTQRRRAVNIGVIGANDLTMIKVKL